MEGQKCGHGPCSCFIDLGELYCGQRCREMAAKDPDEPSHDRCGCRHEECVSAD